MIINVFDTAAASARALAARIRDAIRVKPGLVLGLATGRTPVPIYAELRRMTAAQDLDFSRVTTVNLDEFVGVDAAQPGSFRRFMEEQLFGPVRLPADRIRFLDGTAADLEAECRRYEAAIAAAGGIDLQLLGIGVNGHIGFNEPGDELIARTHRVTLAPTTRRDNAALFGGDAEAVPREALSMGIGTILSAREIVLVASGEHKARCIERLVHGPLTTRLPASFLQLHPRVELYLERAAASLLPR